MVDTSKPEGSPQITALCGPVVPLLIAPRHMAAICLPLVSGSAQRRDIVLCVYIITMAGHV